MDTSAGSQYLDISDSEVEYGSDRHEMEEDNCVVEFFLEVKEKGNRFAIGVIKVKKCRQLEGDVPGNEQLHY